MCICMLNRRVNILWDDGLWTKLVKLSKKRSLSVSELIRRAVIRVYFSQDDERLAAIKGACKEIEKIRPTLNRLNYKELIEHGRKH